MKNIIRIIAFYTLVFCPISDLLAQKGAVITHKEIKNLQQERFQVGRAGENGFPLGGSFRDYEGNFYIYGAYEGAGNLSKIDNVTLNGLHSESLIIVKFDKNYKAIWGHVFDNWNTTQRIKVIQGLDSNIYLLTSSYDNFSLGGLTINKTAINSAASTFIVKLNAQTGQPISGYSIAKDWITYSWFLQDAVVDENGNLYIALESFAGTTANKPDSIRFGNFSAVWREKNNLYSNIAAIVKFDKDLNPIWLHTFSPIDRATFKLALSNNELVVSGYIFVWDNEWTKIYFDNELLTDNTFNHPHGQGNSGFLIKIDSNGIKKWMWPWLMKYNEDDSPGVTVFDMKCDPNGNIYCFLSMGDFESKLNTSWITPSVRTVQKMVKFNKDGILQWMKEPLIKRTGVLYFPKTDEVNCMYVDIYGNSYYSFMLTGNFEEFFLDSIYFSLPIKNMDRYWGLVKLDTDGNAVDAIFPTIANKKKKVGFNNSFKLPYVDNNGTIYQPLTISVYNDTMYIFDKDTLQMDFDSSRNIFIRTEFFTWNEITPKAQLIKEYKNPGCANSNDGYIHLKVIGGASGHYLSWSHGSSDLKLDNLNSGTYVVSLYDSTSQQTMIDTFFLQAPPQLTGSVIVKDDTNNLSNGSITLSMQGGIPPYTYQWNDPNNSTTASINNLIAGSYTVTVTDSNGCVWDTSVTVGNYINSIEEQLKELSVYPNPSKDGTLFIRMSNPKSESIEIIVIDAKGKECHHEVFSSTSKGINQQLHVKLSKGNYIIKIMDGKEHYLRKVSII
jgi:hypothetical protein